jgi:hypothetical protein
VHGNSGISASYGSGTSSCDTVSDPISSGTSGSTSTGTTSGGGGPAVAITTAVGPDVPVQAAGPVEVPRPPVEPIGDLAPLTRDYAVVLMSNVGTGFSAVIIILILLTIGIWYFGHRVAVQLTTQEKRNA